MRILKEETQAVIVDIQERLMPAMNEREEFEKRALMLIRGLRLLEVPMMITQEYTKGLGRSIPDLFLILLSGIYRNKPDAFPASRHPEGQMLIFRVQSYLESHLSEDLSLDAIASRRESDKQAALWRAMQEGILLTTTESLLFELTVDSNNPKFREISRLVK